MQPSPSSGQRQPTASLASQPVSGLPACLLANAVPKMLGKNPRLTAQLSEDGQRRQSGIDVEEQLQHEQRQKRARLKSFVDHLAALA